MFCFLIFREEGETISELFLHLPDRDTYPDYYTIIEEPMSLSMIRKRIRIGQYSSVEEMGADIDLMVRNAKAYNEEDSYAYDCACQIWDRFSDPQSTSMADPDLDNENV